MEAAEQICAEEGEELVLGKSGMGSDVSAQSSNERRGSGNAEICLIKEALEMAECSLVISLRKNRADSSKR